MTDYEYQLQAEEEYQRELEWDRAMQQAEEDQYCQEMLEAAQQLEDEKAENPLFYWNEV